MYFLKNYIFNGFKICKPSNIRVIKEKQACLGHCKIVSESQLLISSPKHHHPREIFKGYEID